jgi:hypothetical protein
MFEVHFVYTVYKTTKIQVQNNLLSVMSCSCYELTKHIF